MNPIIDGQQPSWRLWGEEEHDGAIYTIYLKKVRYHPGTSVSASDSEDKVSHLEWETVRIRIIKAGTLEKLVESLATDSGELESTYVNIFLSTYRSFATPQQILSLVLDRYRQLGSRKIEMSETSREQHKSTLMQALLVWLDMYPEDFFEPPQYLILNQVIEFAQKYLPGGILELRSQHRLEKFKRDGDYKVNCRRIDWCSNYENTVNSPTVLPLKFLEVPEEHFACQLTCMDAELFKKLAPHHCLGSIWSHRDKAEGWNITPTTVTATVNQFNAVSLRVINTILSDPSLKSFVRAKIISKWIDIAQELRFLKNFSSLKAITAALQSNPIYRLRKIWLIVPREKIEAFTELARIFSEDNNQINCRELLIKEGSAKFADTVGIHDRQLQKALQKQLSGNVTSTMQGTIPYLGTFLTDLTMIDTAIPDFLSNGYINFDKRRKEFEILAQIKLLQSAANSYDLTPDVHFQEWFDSIPVLDDSESYELSCLIEPQESSLPEKRPMLQRIKSPAPKWGHKKSDSTSSTSTSSSNSQFYDQISSDASMNSVQPDNNCNIKISKSCSSLSLPSLCSSQSPADSLSRTPEFYIIKVSLEQDCTDAKGINLYKSIMLSNRDRTRTVISNAMMKHDLTGDPEDYILAQVVPGGEIIFPSSANVYYAVNTSYDLNFILRNRRDTDNNGIKKQKPPHLMKRLLHSTS